MLEVCAGMKAIHEMGVIHRDIKPSNICLSAEGQHKIIDMGTALVADSQVLDADVEKKRVLDNFRTVTIEDQLRFAGNLSLDRNLLFGPSCPLCQPL
jgi:serine/threonine protein kinase